MLRRSTSTIPPAFRAGGLCEKVILKKSRVVDAFSEVVMHESKTGKQSWSKIAPQACADLLIQATLQVKPVWNFARGVTGNFADEPKLFENLKTLDIDYNIDL